METAARPRTAKDYQERILRTVVYIQQHLDDALSLDELARLSHFSPFHFHRVFRGLVGESVMEHVRRLRLERAAYRLKHTEEQIVRLAFDAGYETHESFTRAFHAHFGVAPSEFRKQHRQPDYPLTQSGIHYAPDQTVGSFSPIASGELTMNVRIEKIAPQRIAFVRHVGPYKECGPAFGKLFAWAGPRGYVGPTTTCFGLAYDDPTVTPADKLRYDACINVGPNVQAEGKIGVRELPGGEYAIATHRGPYEKLGETYAQLVGQWLPASGRAPGEPPAIERYLNDPRTTPPDQLLTDVCLAIV